MPVIRITGWWIGAPGACNALGRGIWTLGTELLVSVVWNTSLFIEDTSEQVGEWDLDLLKISKEPTGWQFLGGWIKRSGELLGVEVLGVWMMTELLSCSLGIEIKSRFSNLNDILRVKTCTSDCPDPLAAWPWLSLLILPLALHWSVKLANSWTLQLLEEFVPEELELPVQDLDLSATLLSYGFPVASNLLLLDTEKGGRNHWQGKELLIFLV